MKYIIGVDGGGTKTEAVAYDLNGNSLSRSISGYGNILINEEKALNNIKESIEKCTKSLNKSECVYIYAGIAGSTAGNGKEIIKKYIQDKFKCNVIVVNDADLALSALLKGKDGFLTIAGTGSICIGKISGKSIRAGGWGHLLGDEGSGYYIGIQALKSIAYEKDNGQLKSEFTDRILNKLGCKRELDIINFIYNTDKAHVAAIVEVVIQLAKEKNSTATQILIKAGEELGEMTLRAIKQSGLKENIKIGISGNIIRKIEIVKATFIKYLDMNLGNYSIYDEDISPTLGAYYEIINMNI